MLGSVQNTEEQNQDVQTQNIKAKILFCAFFFPMKLTFRLKTGVFFWNSDVLSFKYLAIYKDIFTPQGCLVNKNYFLTLSFRFDRHTLVAGVQNILLSPKKCVLQV